MPFVTSQKDSAQSCVSAHALCKMKQVKDAKGGSLDFFLTTECFASATIDYFLLLSYNLVVRGQHRKPP